MILSFMVSLQSSLSFGNGERCVIVPLRIACLGDLSAYPAGLVRVGFFIFWAGGSLRGALPARVRSHTGQNSSLRKSLTVELGRRQQERMSSRLLIAMGFNPKEIFMKKILIATALTLMCGSAFAQSTTGPASQGDNMTKPGMTNDSMNKGSMDKGSANTGTTGMNDGAMKKDGMSKDGMKNDSMSKDGMKK
jgi:pentapeptide MXKDX repeat protein